MRYNAPHPSNSAPDVDGAASRTSRQRRNFPRFDTSPLRERFGKSLRKRIAVLFNDGFEVIERDYLGAGASRLDVDDGVRRGATGNPNLSRCFRATAQVGAIHDVTHLVGDVEQAEAGQMPEQVKVLALCLCRPEDRQEAVEQGRQSDAPRRGIRPVWLAGNDRRS